ncbi:MAG: putative Ig domain-containing protein, partial [Luteolibacter sp.]
MINKKSIRSLLALSLIGIAGFAPSLEASIRMSSGTNEFANRATLGTSTGWALPAGDWTLGIWDNHFQGNDGWLINGPINLFYVPLKGPPSPPIPEQGHYMVGGTDDAGNSFGSGATVNGAAGTLPVGYPGRVTGKFTPRLHIIRRNAGKSEYLVAEAGHAPVLVSSETRPFGATTVRGWGLANLSGYAELYDADLEGLFFATKSVSDNDIGLMAAGQKPSSVPSIQNNLTVYFPMETASLANPANPLLLPNQGSDSAVGLKRYGAVTLYADGPMLRGAVADNLTPGQVTEPTNVVALNSFQPFQIIRHLNGSANVQFTGVDNGTGAADIQIRFIDVEHATSTAWQTLLTGSPGGGAAIQATIPVPKGYWKTIETRRINSAGGTGDSSRPNRTWSRWAVGEVVVVWGDSIQGQVQRSDTTGLVAANGFTAKYPTSMPYMATMTGDTNALSTGMWNLLGGGGMGGGTQGENEIANNLSAASQCCVGISTAWAGATRLGYWNGNLSRGAYDSAKAYCLANGGLNKPSVITWVGNLASANYGDNFYTDLDLFKNLVDADFGAGTWQLLLAPVPIMYDGSGGSAPGFQTLRDSCRRWLRDNPQVGQAAGVSLDHLTSDGVHPDLAAWNMMGPRWGNAAGYLRDQVNYVNPRGGEIVNFYRSSGNLIAQVQLYAGTSLSLKNPGSNISGFTLSADNFATTVPISSAVLLNGTTVRITPTGSLPAGALKLRYLYGKPGISGSTLAQEGVDNILYVNAGPTNVVAIEPIWGTSSNSWSLAEGTTSTPPPVITTFSLPAGKVGDAYIQTLAATGGASPYTWSLVSGTLPSGLTLSSGGVIAGTPGSQGTSNFTIGVAGTDTASSTASYTLVINSLQGPSITTASLPGGTVGTAYNQSLAATGGATPYTWSLVSGTLPSGLSLSSGGVISGTPGAQGTSGFTIGVAGSDNASSTATFSLTVSSLQAPSMTTTTLPVGKVGDVYNQTLAAVGGSLPYTWSLASGTLPSGLTLSSDGVISGTPDASGTSSFTIKVTGNDNAFSTAGLSLTVSINQGTGSLYWDGNSTTAGAGNTTGLLNKVWGTDTAWNTDAAGVTDTFTAATSAGDDLFFVAAPGAASGAVGFNPTVTGTQAANSITFQSSGALTLSGGTINLDAGGLMGSQYAYGTTNRGAVTISSAIVLQAAQSWVNNASNAMTVSGLISGTSNIAIQNGATSTQTLSGVNVDYSGTTTLTAGTLTGAGTAVDTFSALGTGGIVLNGGTLQLKSNGSGNGGKTIVAANNLTSGSAAVTVNVNNNGGNSQNTISLNNLSIGSGQFNVTGSNQYALRFAGTTALTGNATVNATSSSLSLVSIIGDGGGGFGLTKTGATASYVSTQTGVLTLSGANTYTGVTAVYEGILTLNSAGALGNATSAVLLGNTTGSVNAYLLAGNVTVGRNITVQSGNTGTAYLGSASTSSSGIYSGNITLGTTSGTGHGLTLVTGAYHQLAFNGVIQDPTGLSGAGGLLTIGSVTTANFLTGTFSPNPTNSSSIIYMSGANTYTGGTVINTLAGNVRINNATAFGTGILSIVSGTIQGDGTSVLSGISGQTWDGDFSLNSFNFSPQGAVNLGTSAISLSANRTVTVLNNNSTVGGVISGSGRSLLLLGGSNAGSGLNLNGASTFDGGLTIAGASTTANAITVTSGNASSLGTGQLNLTNTANSKVALNTNTTVGSLTSGLNNGLASFTGGTSALGAGNYALTFTGGGGTGAAGTATVSA